MRRSMAALAIACFLAAPGCRDSEDCISDPNCTLANTDHKALLITATLRDVAADGSELSTVLVDASSFTDPLCIRVRSESGRINVPGIPIVDAGVTPGNSCAAAHCVSELLPKSSVRRLAIAYRGDGHAGNDIVTAEAFLTTSDCAQATAPDYTATVEMTLIEHTGPDASASVLDGGLSDGGAL